MRRASLQDIHALLHPRTVDLDPHDLSCTLRLYKRVWKVVFDHPRPLVHPPAPQKSTEVVLDHPRTLLHPPAIQESMEGRSRSSPGHQRRAHPSLSETTH